MLSLLRLKYPPRKDELVLPVNDCQAPRLAVTEALRGLISIRQFTSRPLSLDQVTKLLEAARWSPSGGNLQPWKVIALAGVEQQAVAALAQRAGANPGADTEEGAGRGVHGAGDFEFFRAPVGLFFVIDQRLGRHQWAHLGMFMQSLALAALEQGFGTCTQEFCSTLRVSLHRHFGLPATDLLHCGMALGHPVPAAPINQLRSWRVPVEKFATLRGF